MDFNELVAKAKGTITSTKELAGKVRQDYAASAGLVSFVKEQVSKEILEKKERIPGAIIAVWILFLLIFYDMAIVVNFGVFPVIIYFTVRMIKNAPTN